jgi:hypothetical protein
MSNKPSTQAYAEELSAASGRALRIAGVYERKLGMAGQIISLKFAGTALQQAILPALSHLIVGTNMTADLTVMLWDTASTGVSLPGIPWRPPTDEAWKISEDQHLALFLPARNNLVWLDRVKNQAYYWIPDAASTRGVEICDPMLNLWSWWFMDTPTQLVHAAAVGGRRGAALLVGGGGSGKSTTALLTLNSPLRYLADDYCLVTLQPSLTVHSLFASAKVLRADRRNHPWLEQAYLCDNDEKSLYVLFPSLAGRLAQQMPLRALINPCISREPSTRLEPDRPMNILRALAPSTIMQLHTGTDPARILHSLAALAGRLPCYRLILGTDYERIPSILATLLDD